MMSSEDYDQMLKDLKTSIEDGIKNASEVRDLAHAQIPDIHYLCDRKACGGHCSYPTCKHTTDITHAKNFVACGDKEHPAYEEQESRGDLILERISEETIVPNGHVQMEVDWVDVADQEAMHDFTLPSIPPVPTEDYPKHEYAVDSPDGIVYYDSLYDFLAGEKDDDTTR